MSTKQDVISFSDEIEDDDDDWYQFWIYGVNANGSRVRLRGAETEGDAHWYADMLRADRPEFTRFVIEEWL